ncbi:stalk domain-containing protein [Paenibacillus hamazuiensis]|uniref:stalk domain-containing protein n=1 Tax=Paenibacillus hamazuiensis TaxID=2936508 RepID=UPI00200D96BC|nr:stalk domain-containing protein [Paenibacillus hamazuiensis]
MQRTNRPGKIWTLLLLAFLIGSANLVFPVNYAHAFSYGYRTAPENTVGVAKPTIAFYLSTDVVTDPSNYAMYVNGESVPVTYDREKGLFTYVPAKSLAPGSYTVRMTINYAGYVPLEKTWTFTIAKDALQQFAPPSSDQTAGLAAVNDYRTVYGLPPVQLNDRLSASATAHAQYLNNNKIQQDGKSQDSLHDQDPGKAGFFGKTPLERAAYFGYTDNVGEDAAYFSGTVSEVTDALFDAPYHRSPLLDPYIREVGIAKIGDYTIIEFGTGSDGEPKLVVSPAEGERYVPTSFEGNEEPDPLRIHTGSVYPVGYPIMAEFYGTGIDKVKLVSAELTDGAKRPVDLLVNTPDTDDKLSKAVILTPSKPLQPDTGYHAKVSVQAVKKDGSTVTQTKEWDFTTEPAPTVGKQLMHKNAADYKKYYVTVYPTQRVATFGLDATSYQIDGISFPMKRTPVIVDGFSYLYIRDLAAALGANVDWDEQQRAAIYTKGSLKVTLFTTTNQIAVNGTIRQTDTPARLIGENTMVPVRLLAEVLGAKVDYIDATRTVKITY